MFFKVCIGLYLYALVLIYDNPNMFVILMYEPKNLYF